MLKISPDLTQKGELFWALQIMKSFSDNFPANIYLFTCSKATIKALEKGEKYV